MIPVLAFLEVFPWFVEELVVLASSLYCSGFCSVGAVGYSESCDVMKEARKEVARFLEVVASG